MLCGGPCIALFSSTELERLVCGTPLLDFTALQGAAKYEGFTREDQVTPPHCHPSVHLFSNVPIVFQQHRRVPSRLSST